MKIPFAQIDAFADRPFTGNPAAVMPLDAWLADDVLQAIASENNLSETAFLIPDATGAAEYELRWHTPTVEVALCGHATLAAGHFVLSTARPARDRTTFRTRQSGILEVRRTGDRYLLDLPAWAMHPQPCPEIAAHIGGNPTATYWREGGYSMLVYASAAEVLALRPDFKVLAAIDPGDILYIATAPGTETDIVSRVFAPGAGIDEDPVTGSAHCLLTPYWAERLSRDTFTAYQASARGGHVGCQLSGDRVILSGGCLTVIEGVFTL